jgi:hypothetical protein
MNTGELESREELERKGEDYLKRLSQCRVACLNFREQGRLIEKL